MSGDTPEDVLHFAREAAGAFPTIPLIAVDVIRDVFTGSLFALEVNTSGWSFCISSDTRHRILREFGFDLMTQFGGARAIARGIHRHITAEAPACLT
jgi:hypothetical protein